MNLVEHAAIDADIDDAYPAAMNSSRQQQMPGLAAEERHRLGGTYRDAHHGTGVAVNTARQIDAEDRRAVRVDRRDDVAEVALDRPVEARTEQRVDDQGGRADRARIAWQYRMLPAPCRERRVALQGVAVAEQDDGDVSATRCKLGRRDKTVAAIIAASGDDKDRALLDQIHCRLRHSLAGLQHQRKARSACGDRQPVGMLHLGRGENFHA